MKKQKKVRIKVADLKPKKDAIGGRKHHHHRQSRTTVYTPPVVLAPMALANGIIELKIGHAHRASRSAATSIVNTNHSVEFYRNKAYMRCAV